ncbi:MAG: hypothetical protein ACYSX0_12250 [Planctomycetota bacterium]|jgi:hypothetical protein
MRLVGATFLVIAAAALTFAEAESAPEFGAPDLLFFERIVASELHARCAGCHSDAEAAGARFFLVPLDDFDRPARSLVLKNYRACLPLIDPDEPANSKLLRKALGADSHGGGALYRPTGRTYEALLHFAMGATAGNRPPEAIVQKRYDCAAGEELELDGTLSGDPEGDPIRYRWRMAERPPGSGADVEANGQEEGYARFVPDVVGVYRVELSVHDGTLWSLPEALMVVAERGTAGTKKSGKSTMGSFRPPVRPTPPAPSLSLGRLDPQRLRLMRRLFMDLKWRSPYLREIAEWYPRSHEEMVKAFLSEEETWAAWYERQLFYFLLLDRFRPKEGRLTTIPRRLASGEISGPRAVEEIVRSQYFGARNPGNDTFVTVVLEQCLGLVVQERRNKRLLDIGKRMYDGYKAILFKEKGRSQADFVRIVFKQRGFHVHLLARTWKDLHGEAIDRKRLQPFVDRVAQDPRAFRTVMQEWLTGPAYVQGATVARTKPEIPYVRSLFVDLLGRLPSYEELRNVRNAFLSLADPTPIRLVMGRVLLQSSQSRMPASAIDAERFVKEQFVRLLARPATLKEVETFVAALKSDSNVTPNVVLWTLVSSPEYQTY